MMPRRIASSIVTKIILFGICIALIGAAGRVYFFSKFLRADLERVVSAQQEATASYVAHDIEDKIVNRQRFLAQLAKTFPVSDLNRPAKIRDWLKERHELQPLFSLGISVIDLKGRVVADYPVQEGKVGTDYGDRDVIRAAIAGEAAIGRPVLGRVTSEPLLPMGAPIKDQTGKVVAVLSGVTALGSPEFMDLIRQGKIGETGGLLLVSPSDGIFVYANQPELIMKETAQPGINALHDRAMAGYRGSGVTINVQGVEEISSIASVPTTGWFVVARMPTEEAFATVKRARNYILGSLPITLAVFIMLASIGLFVVFRPLLRSATLADRMTLGEIPYSPLPVERQDEVGHLTASFNRLLGRLLDSQFQLEKIAHHDALTGLPNRHLLSDRMSQILARSSRNNTHLAVLFLDLDAFKPINDTLGHEAGDQALVLVANRLTSVVRESDTLARVGGDEFVLVMTDLDPSVDLAASAACVVAKKCIDVIDQPITLAGGDRTLGVSVGIAVGNGSDSFDSLLSAADKAMYQAKDSGRGCYVLSP